MPNTNSYRWPEDRDPLWAADAIEERILFEGPETVSAVILEPVQNAGGCFVPQEGYFQRVREICDKYGVLLISDEVICSWGRLGHYFGCERYGYQPDIITTAKGLTSAYAPMGAVIASDRVAEPFMEGKNMFAHGFTFGGHPVAAAVAHGEPRHLRARGPVRPRAREGGRVPRRCSTACATSRSSATCAAPASSTRIELVKDQETKESFDDEESEALLRGFLSGELYERGPDLPRRRPRRPGDPALAAADRRTPSSSRRSRRILRTRADRGLREDGRAG